MSEDSQHNRIISIKNKNGEHAYLYDCLGNMHEQLDGDTLPTSLISKLMSTVSQLDLMSYDLNQLKNKFPNVFFNDDYGPIIIDEDVVIIYNSEYDIKTERVSFDFKKNLFFNKDHTTISGEGRKVISKSGFVSYLDKKLIDFLGPVESIFAQK